MTLNSLDIQNKTFNTQMRGFNKQEVDEFLDLVIRDYDEFVQTIKDQDRELKSLRERVKYFDDMKDSLNKSIVVAQEAADNLKTQSQSESSSIIAEASQKGQLIIEAAKKEASTVLNQASEDARRLVRDTDELKRQTRLYHQKVTAIIEAQLNSIHSVEWEEVLKQESSHITNPEEKLQEIVDVQLSKTSLAQKPIEESAAVSEAAKALSEVPAAPSANTVASAAQPEAIKVKETSAEQIENVATARISSTSIIFPEIETVKPEGDSDKA